MSFQTLTLATAETSSPTVVLLVMTLLFDDLAAVAAIPTPLPLMVLYWIVPVKPLTAGAVVADGVGQRQVGAAEHAAAGDADGVAGDDLVLHQPGQFHPGRVAADGVRAEPVTKPKPPAVVLTVATTPAVLSSMRLPVSAAAAA